MKLNELMAAVEAELGARYPGEPVYWDMMPKEFKRPSFTLECQKEEETDVNIGLIRRTVTLLVTCYVAVDAYGDSSREALNERQEGVQAIFGRGYIPVGGRSLGVQANRGAGSPEVAEVTAVFSWVEARPGYQDPEKPATPETGGAPVMEQFKLNVSGKE